MSSPVCSDDTSRSFLQRDYRNVGTIGHLLSGIRDAFCGDTCAWILNCSEQALVLFVTAKDPLSGLPDYTVRPEFTREIPPNEVTSLDCRKLLDIEKYGVNTSVVLRVFPKIAGDPKSNPGSYFEPGVRAKGFITSRPPLEEKKIIALYVSKNGKVEAILATGGAA